jgi:DNA-directed RNA polymerase specialized sigma24 family protein
MIDELDDISYNHNDYVLNHVFIEDKENKIIEKLDKKLSKETIKKHTDMVVNNLPSTMRNVFILYTNQHLSIEEIAQLKNKTIGEIEMVLKDVKEALKVSFFNRYPLD